MSLPPPKIGQICICCPEVNRQLPWHITVHVHVRFLSMFANEFCSHAWTNGFLKNDTFHLASTAFEYLGIVGLVTFKIKNENENKFYFQSAKKPWERLFFIYSTSSNPVLFLVTRFSPQPLLLPNGSWASVWVNQRIIVHQSVEESHSNDFHSFDL